MRRSTLAILLLSPLLLLSPITEGNVSSVTRVRVASMHVPQPSESCEDVVLIELVKRIGTPQLHRVWYRGGKKEAVLPTALFNGSMLYQATLDVSFHSEEALDIQCANAAGVRHTFRKLASVSSFGTGNTPASRSEDWDTGTPP